MSDQSVSFTCDECGYQAAELALVIEHLRTAHGITETAEVGRLTQRDGLLRLRSGDRETIIDLAAGLADGLGAGQAAPGKPPAESMKK